MKEATLFGQNLKEARKAANWSQEQLSEATGLHRTYVGSVERGERNPSLKAICSLARGLGIEAAALMSNLPNRVVD